MNFKSVFKLTLLTGLTLLSGCSDLFTSKVVKRALESSQFSANCDLDIDKFSQIMYEKIPEPIHCLGENLNLFIRVVETDKPGYLSKQRLVEFIEKNRTDIGPDALRALKAVFDINFLLFGENKNYISKDNVKKIIEFATIFNDKAALNFRIFESSDSLAHNEYVVLRNRIDDNSLFLTNKLRDIFNSERNGEIHSLNIVEVLESFTTENNRGSIDKVKKLLFVKKMILGGDRETITHTELEYVIQNFNNLSTIVLDGARFKNIKLDNEEIVDFLRRPLSSLSKIIFGNGSREKESFFEFQEAIDAFKLFQLSGSFNVDQFRPLLNEAKQILMGGSPNVVTGGEFKKLLNHATKVLVTGSAFYQIYDNFKAQLESTRPLTIDFTQYRHNYPDRVKELEEFSRIITSYRFFKGEALSATYSTGYSRNPQAIFEIYLYEYIFKLVFNHKSFEDGRTVPWASASNGLGGKSMNAAEVLALVKRFEKELIAMNMILPNRATSTANTISLLGSLFQFQSDDNKLLDVNEATEFALSLFTSMDVASELMDYYTKKSGCEQDEYQRIEPTCFKKHFFKAICAKNYRQYYPRFFESLDASNPASCEVQMNQANSTFLDSSIRAGRTCNIYPDDQKEIPYSKGDMFGIFLTMIHVETTITKWDVRGIPNNIMDSDEVLDAYPTYSTALDGFLDEMPNFIKALKKQIFQFLIKYEEIPSKKNIGKFLKFLIGKKKAPANRNTIAKLLAVISEESVKKTPENERYDCNTLHHPAGLKAQVQAPSTAFAVKPALDHWMEVETNQDYQNFMSNPSLKED